MRLFVGINSMCIMEPVIEISKNLLRSKKVFMVYTSAVNYEHEQKSYLSDINCTQFASLPPLLCIDRIHR